MGHLSFWAKFKLIMLVNLDEALPEIFCNTKKETGRG
jgi:hypothetical protein